MSTAFTMKSVFTKNPSETYEGSLKTYKDKLRRFKLLHGIKTIVSIILVINGLRLVKDYKDTCPEYAKAGILEGIASLLFIVLNFVAIHAIRVQTLRSWKIYFPCGVVVCLIRIGVTIAFLVDYKVIKDCAGDSTIRTLVGAIVAALIYGSVVWEGRVLGNITRKYATDISFSN